jgi:hypothetical protein
MTFEDEFSAKQTDMIQLALEYADRVEQKIDTVYIYGSFETMYSFDVFYKDDRNNIVMLHELSQKGMSESEIDNLIFSVLKLGNQDLQDIHKICRKYNRPMPTQIKLIYDNIQNKVSGKYSYDLFYSNSDTLTADDIFEQWYKEIKEEVEGHNDF